MFVRYKLPYHGLSRLVSRDALRQLSNTYSSPAVVRKRVELTGLRTTIAASVESAHIQSGGASSIMSPWW